MAEHTGTLVFGFLIASHVCHLCTQAVISHCCLVFNGYLCFYQSFSKILPWAIISLVFLLIVVTTEPFFKIYLFKIDLYFMSHWVKMNLIALGEKLKGIGEIVFFPKSIVKSRHRVVNLVSLNRHGQDWL